jgi:hypothetical protein
MLVWQEQILQQLQAWETDPCVLWKIFNTIHQEGPFQHSQKMESKQDKLIYSLSALDLVIFWPILLPSVTVKNFSHSTT